MAFSAPIGQVNQHDALGAYQLVRTLDVRASLQHPAGGPVENRQFAFRGNQVEFLSGGDQGPAVGQGKEGIVQGHKGAVDGRRTRTAIGLQHIAVDQNAALTEGAQQDHNAAL